MLKSIVLIRMNKGETHVKDLAETHQMNLTTAYSVVKRLTKNGYINPLDPHRGGRTSNKQSLILTPSGEALAKRILDRHEIVHSWLLRLGVPYEQADEEACDMEHGISDSTMAILERHVSMVSEKTGMPEAPVGKVMDRMKQIHATNHPMTVSDKVHEAVEYAGGVEGIYRKEALLAKVGGEDATKEMLEMVDALGGLEVWRKEKKQLLALKKLVDEKEDIKYVQKVFAYLDFIGGFGRLRSVMTTLEKNDLQLEALEQLVELKKSIGLSEEQWDVNFAKWKKLSRDMGGVEKMLSVLEKEQEIWKEIYRR
ncbi:metal-dependent transcriptional regulator [Chakrabartyella piscis]|uniref:metal-dependent transcriptional regulator n=1 Tax=Chakrabartyella piscis TaxID=2918914 RepID=UPI0029586786|nr:iron dependent repressor, metal binding and dimerization domain protein [Chakrabartyella piscis]